MKVFVLRIRTSGEEDEVFLFHHLRDAWMNVYAYFGEDAPEKITFKAVSDLEARYFDEDKGYFTITEQEIN